MKCINTVLSALTLLVLLGHAQAQVPPVANRPDAVGKISVTGMVPDEASRSAILAKLRDIYGAGNVQDQLEVGGVIPPANWLDRVTKMIDPALKNVRQGSLQVNGTQVTLKGSVPNEATRQNLGKHLASAVNATYSINNALVSTDDGQSLLDKTLANRVVEFESGSAQLTSLGQTVLDEMAASIKQLGNPKIQLIGHTDNSGDRRANIALSQSRATAARDYLVQKGIAAGTLTVMGRGPDQPINGNETPEGRAKNRRIEFRLIK